MAQISVEWAESDCSLVTIADTNVVDCVFQYTALRVCKVFEEPTTSECTWLIVNVGVSVLTT